MLNEELNGSQSDSQLVGIQLAEKGVELLANTIESYVSNNATSESKRLCAKAIGLICQNLELAVNDQSNIEAYTQLKMAAKYEAEAYHIASLGCVQAMSKQLDKVCSISSARSSAVLLPHIQNFNRFAVAGELTEVAQLMGIDTSDMKLEESSRAAIIYLKALNQRLGLAKGLATLGVSPFDLEAVAALTMESSCIKTSPVEMSQEQVLLLFKQAM